MGIVSSIFWIMAGLFYILYRSYKEEPGFTLAGIFLTISSVLAIVGFIELGDFLMRIDTTLGNIFVIGGAAAIVLAFILWLRKLNREEDERCKRLNERIARYNEMFETDNFTKEFLLETVKEFKQSDDMRLLEIRLGRKPTEEEIRDAAIEKAKQIHQRNMASLDAMIKRQSMNR